MNNKILVIEDDRAISELLCMNLEAAGYETVAAYDGEEAQRRSYGMRMQIWQWWISCCREKTDLELWRILKERYSGALPDCKG